MPLRVAMWKHNLNLAITIVVIGASGFLLPLRFARRITLVGLVVSLTGFGLGAVATGWVAQEFGVLRAVAVAVMMNFAVAGFWLWFVFRITARMRREKPVA